MSTNLTKDDVPDRQSEVMHILEAARRESNDAEFSLVWKAINRLERIVEELKASQQSPTLSSLPPRELAAIKEFQKRQAATFTPEHPVKGDLGSVPL